MKKAEKEEIAQTVFAHNYRREERPDENLERVQLYDLLEQALDRLPFTERRMAQLRYMYGMSYEEIGKEVGLSVTNVQTILRKVTRMFMHPLRSEEVRIEYRNQY
jgi:RNA polymerase sigma factor (sigma-70 family)